MSDWTLGMQPGDYFIHYTRGGFQWINKVVEVSPSEIKYCEVYPSQLGSRVFDEGGGWLMRKLEPEEVVAFLLGVLPKEFQPKEKE